MSAEIHDFQRGRGERQAPGPQNIEAEQALLGAIFINNEAFGQVSGFLKTEHFSEELHRRIYDVASQFIRAGKVATPITLKTFLGDTDLGGVTIPQYLARLAARRGDGDHQHEGLWPHRLRPRNATRACRNR